jgi:hypothetical protein
MDALLLRAVASRTRAWEATNRPIQGPISKDVTSHVPKIIATHMQQPSGMLDDMESGSVGSVNQTLTAGAIQIRDGTLTGRVKV